MSHKRHKIINNVKKNNENINPNYYLIYTKTTAHQNSILLFLDIN